MLHVRHVHCDCIFVITRAARATICCHMGTVSPKSRERFGPEKPVVKVQSACFEKLIF